eukprot:g11529.t1
MSGQQLYEEAEKGNLKRVQELLAQRADVETKGGRWNNTALIETGVNGRTDIAQALLAAGANVNATGRDGCTALHHAGGYGQTATAQALLAAGAQTEAKSNGGNTALHMAGAYGQTATAQALLAAGAQTEAKSNGGDTALILAGLNGHTATAQALLAAGAHIEAKSNSGATALDLARSNNKPETVKLLEEAAKVRDLVSRAERGQLTPADKSNLDSMAEALPWTALQYASLHGLHTAAKNILDSKASVDKPNKASDVWQAMCLMMM